MTLQCAVIDDEPLAREGISGYIAEVDFLELAGTGANPLELQTLLERKQIDLIFLDINLPKIDGFNCLKEIQSSAKHCRIPIVMYSSSDNPNEINAAYGFGASLYFRKPIAYIDLVNSIRDILTMKWDNPELIKKQYFVKGKYQSFTS